MLKFCGWRFKGILKAVLLVPVAVLPVLMAVLSSGCQVAHQDEPSPIAAIIQQLLPESSQQKRQKLMARLGSPDADLRREGVLMLGEGEAAGWKATPEILEIMAIGDTEAQVRAAAVGVLVRIDEKERLPDVLAKTSQDVSALVRLESVAGLSSGGDDGSMNLLVNMLNRDTESEIRGRAAAALGNYPNRRSVQALIAALDDDDFGVIYQAEQSLRKLTGKDFSDDARRWNEWLIGTEDPFVKSAAEK